MEFLKMETPPRLVTRRGSSVATAHGAGIQVLASAGYEPREGTKAAGQTYGRRLTLKEITYP